MIKCPNCGHENVDTVQFCTRCGQSFSEQILERKRQSARKVPYFVAGFITVVIGLTLISLGFGNIWAANSGEEIDRQFGLLDEASRAFYSGLRTEGLLMATVGFVLIGLSVILFWLSRAERGNETEASTGGGVG